MFVMSQQAVSVASIKNITQLVDNFSKGKKINEVEETEYDIM
jgi:hypothetical protein